MQRDEFQSAFWATKKAMAEAAEAAFNQHGVRAGQQFILECLWEADGQTPGELAKRLELATPTVTRAATRMEAAGLLRREAHPHDARLVRLCLTERGRHLEKTLEQERLRLTDRALNGLSNEQREQLIRLLETIHTNLGGRK
ncbi:MarR family winged helix-turn-helix transcriptional regulator [Rugosimonospora acidiphila]|uniref:MarR family winged helix-turn-helix transcriptional regulator n=1 Tax=Rugosimonospora acidiphila TaxID=556531 RepID=A0ABP9RRT4_9ACTN